MKKKPFEPMQRPKGRAHPSGRPITSERKGIESRWRIPDGPLLPGLQYRGFTEAIGFTAGLTSYYDDE